MDVFEIWVRGCLGEIGFRDDVARDDVSMRQSSGWASWRVRVQVERLGEIAFSMKVFERSDSA